MVNGDVRRVVAQHHAVTTSRFSHTPFTMYHSLSAWCCVSAIMVSGCASIPPAQLGQTAGTIAGAMLVPGIGAPLGGVVGLLAGMVVQNHIDQVTETRERKELGQQLETPLPISSAQTIPATGGEPRRVWVDETVRDGRVVAGHFDVRYLP